jgi:hypothetical protein
MEFTGVALRRSLPAASPAAARGRGEGRRRAPARVSCVGGGGFAEEGHLRYYEAAAPRRKAVEAVARDLVKLRAMGLVAGDAAKEKVLSVSPLFLSPSSTPFGLISVPFLGIGRGISIAC